MNAYRSRCSSGRRAAASNSASHSAGMDSRPPPALFPGATIRRFYVRLLLRLLVASREDARDVVQDVRRAGLVVPELLDQPPFHDVDLGLGLVVRDAADEVLELDRVAAVLEELQLQGLVQPGVGVVLELLAVERQGLVQPGVGVV